MAKRYDFDKVTVLSAFAVGEPGKRTFFLAVGQNGEWLRIWLEKQELQALALGVRKLLFNLSQQQKSSFERTEVASSSDVPSKLPSAELEVSEMTLGYDGEMVTLDASVRQMGPKGVPARLHCLVTLALLRQLGNEADAVCAAGRPICPLCGEPVDPTGHDCPAKN